MDGQPRAWRQPHPHIIWPVAALVAGAIVLMAGLVCLSAVRQDELGLQHEKQMITHMVGGALEDVALMAKDYSWWNDSIRYLVLSLDPLWADDNIGRYVFDTFGFELSFVLDRNDRTIYASIDGERLAGDAVAELGEGLLQLIEAARAKPTDEPEPVWGILKAGDTVVATGVSAITPEINWTEPQPAGPRSVIVLAKRLGAEFLEELESGFGVRDLHISPPGGDTGEAKLPLIAPNGTTIAEMTWRSSRPGKALLAWVAPGLSVSLIAFVGFTGLVLRHIRRATETIKAGETRFRDVAEVSSDWIWETDAELRFSYLSGHFTEAARRPIQDVLDRPLHELFAPAEDLDFGHHHLGDIEARRPFRNLICRLDDGTERARVLRIAGRPIFDQKGRFAGYRGTATDITSDVEAQAEVRYLAHHDALTGLPNRVLLYDRLQRALANTRRRDESFAVLCLDLDQFKEINDSEGHATGDLLIKKCAERLSAVTRDTDTVARLGGDEFTVVVVGNDDASGIQALCERLLAAITQPFDLNGRSVVVTTSIGVALAPAHGTDPGRLLQSADIALFRAKAAGRNTFRFFEARMDAEIRQRRQLEADLCTAVSAGELELHYQPQISVDRRQLVGVEALVRWRHPERGLMAPGEFIPLAEATGYINQLGEWVLQTACSRAARWPRVNVSVNLSPLQFKGVALIRCVEEALEESKLAAERLELEITEGALLKDAEASTTALDRLKALGVRIAMDDFGTGYSSLSYLQRFPFDKIKIDRSFIRDLQGQGDAAVIVKAVIDLGRNLRMRTCAEGVERMDQLVFLEQAGCHEVQGFLFSKPVPAMLIDKIMAAWPVSPPDAA